VTLIQPVAESLGCRMLKDGLLYVLFLLVLAGFMAAFLFAVNWFARSFAARSFGFRKKKPNSKGAS
jgi:uncharacterized membrane protein YphA (DoxX/SURF4 family)